jgi:hypothetical protein
VVQRHGDAAGDGAVILADKDHEGMLRLRSKVRLADADKILRRILARL